MVGEEAKWLRIVVWCGGRFNCNCVCSRNVRESEGGGYLTLWERKMWYTCEIVVMVRVYEKGLE